MRSGVGSTAGNGGVEGVTELGRLHPRAERERESGVGGAPGWFPNRSFRVKLSIRRLNKRKGSCDARSGVGLTSEARVDIL